MAEKLKQAEITSVELAQCQARNNMLQKIDLKISEAQYLRELVVQDNVGFAKKLAAKYNLEEANEYVINNGVLKPVQPAEAPAQPTDAK